MMNRVLVVFGGVLVSASCLGADPFLDFAGNVKKTAQDAGHWAQGAAHDVEQTGRQVAQNATHWVEGAAHDTGDAIKKPVVKVAQTVVAGINIAADIKAAVAKIESAIKPIQTSIAQFPKDFPNIVIDMNQLTGKADANFTRAAHNIGAAFDKNVKTMLNNLMAVEKTYKINSQAGIEKIKSKDMSGIRDVVNNTISGATDIYKASIQGAEDFANSMVLANKLVTDSLSQTMLDLYDARWREPFMHTFDMSDQLVAIVRSLVKLLDTINADLIKTVAEEHAAYENVNKVSKDIQNVVDDVQNITTGLRQAMKK